MYRVFENGDENFDPEASTINIVRSIQNDRVSAWHVGYWCKRANCRPTEQKFPPTVVYDDYDLELNCFELLMWMVWGRQRKRQRKRQSWREHILKHIIEMIENVKEKKRTHKNRCLFHWINNSMDKERSMTNYLPRTSRHHSKMEQFCAKPKSINTHTVSAAFNGSWMNLLAILRCSKQKQKPSLCIYCKSMFIWTKNVHFIPLNPTNKKIK